MLVQPRLAGSKVWARPTDKWVLTVETQGEPREEGSPSAEVPGLGRSEIRVEEGARG